VETRVNYLLLAIAMLGTFFSATAARIFNISMPTVAATLGTDLLGISWALLAFQLSNIGLSIIFGRLADLWGRERIIALGFIVFSLSSFLCGVSQNVYQLIGFRFLQGIGAAMIQSSSRALAADAVPEHLGGRAQGYMTTAHHTGFLLGPSIGGLTIDYLSWRWTFFLLVPIGLIGSLLTLANLKGRPTSVNRVSIDYVGAALIFAATTTLILLFDRRAIEIMGAESEMAIAVAFLGCVAGLIAYESKAESPFLNLSLFKIRLFSCSALSLLIISTCYTIPFFLLPFYLQNVLFLSPSFIGLLFMVPPIITVILAPLSGTMADRFGPRLPASFGILFLIISLVLGYFFQTNSHWLLPTSMIALGAITNGFFNPANSKAMISMMPREHRGFATAVNHVVFGMGNVLGVAIGGFLMTAAFEVHTGLSGVSLTTDNPVGFVAALNTTFLAVVGLSLLGLVTSLARGNRAS